METAELLLRCPCSLLPAPSSACRSPSDPSWRQNVLSQHLPRGCLWQFFTSVRKMRHLPVHFLVTHHHHQAVAVAPTGVKDTNRDLLTVPQSAVSPPEQRAPRRLRVPHLVLRLQNLPRVRRCEEQFVFPLIRGTLRTSQEYITGK